MMLPCGVMASETRARQAGRDRGISTYCSWPRSSPFAPLVSKGANISSQGGRRRGMMQPPPAPAPALPARPLRLFL